MSDDQVTPEEQKELEELAGHVANALASGETQAQVSQELVKGGWEQADAKAFVSSVAAHVESARKQHARSGGGSGVPGCLIWIGILLLINFLSYLFDWPFWIY